MGWWSTDVFGGDQPLDVLDAIAAHIGICGPAGFLPTPDAWDRALATEVGGGIERFGGIDVLAAEVSADNDPVAVQVVVAVAMGAGIALDATWRQRGIAACRDDEFARAHPARADEMDWFAALVTAYDGAPMATRHRGLFDVRRARKDR